jgi:hypothetical protein
MRRRKPEKIRRRRREKNSAAPARRQFRLRRNSAAPGSTSGAHSDVGKFFQTHGTATPNAQSHLLKQQWQCTTVQIQHWLVFRKKDRSVAAGVELPL